MNSNFFPNGYDLKRSANELFPDATGKNGIMFRSEEQVISAGVDTALDNDIYKYEKYFIFIL